MVNKKKLLVIGYSALIISCFVGCDSKQPNGGDGSSSQQSAPPSSESRLAAPLTTPGITYKYIKDGECKESDKEICLSAQDYKSFCVFADGISKSVANRLAMSNGIAFSLYDGGFVESTDVKWVPNGTIYECRATLVVQGNYRGSSRREVLDGAAMFFQANDDGKIYVTYADPASP